MRTVVNRWTSWVAALVVSISFVLLLWLRSPPSKARYIQPLLFEIDGSAVTNGAYPRSFANFTSFSNLTQRFTVYAGESDSNGITWQPQEVSGHDFTVMVDTNGYEVFLPVGRIKLVSFSSFPVWRYDSSARKWQKGRIHWSYSGSFWPIE